MIKRLEQLPDKAKEQRKAHELFFKKLKKKATKELGLRNA